MDLPDSPPPNPPILPYRGIDIQPRPNLPAASNVYRVFGIISLTTAGVSWLFLLSGPALFGMKHLREQMAPACCILPLTWIVSACLSACIIVRDRGVGRRFALLALTLDFVLLVTVLGLWNVFVS